MTSTPGTKIAATRSTHAWIGARLAWVSSTSLATAASRVSSPTDSTRARRNPSVLRVPARSASPAPRVTGTASPVNWLSSKAPRPSSTQASAGTRSPGRRTSRSPTRRASRGTSTSAPWRQTRARSGSSAASPLTASEARARARSSSQRPKHTKVTIIAAVSKKSGAPRCQARADASSAARVPREISVSMSAVACRARRQAPR